MIENDHPVLILQTCSRSRMGGIEAPQATRAVSGAQTVDAIEYEMDSKTLTQVCVIDFATNKVIYDQLVKPPSPTTHYLTRFGHKLYVSLLLNPEHSFSGITATVLEFITTTLADVQTRLRTIITPSTILPGRSLQSDLRATTRAPCIDATPPPARTAARAGVNMAHVQVAWATLAPGMGSRLRAAADGLGTENPENPSSTAEKANRTDTPQLPPAPNENVVDPRKMSALATRLVEYKASQNQSGSAVVMGGSACAMRWGSADERALGEAVVCARMGLLFVGVKTPHEKDAHHGTMEHGRNEE
ncbi:hypothetical protein BJV78DRAFT_1158203 [Lactifluus subvellereus]|nr:hypothetical protein BJV78DRAFT_1158203 [Lactifluus subvellereus]